MAGMKWDELPRTSDADRNKRIQGSKMTTRKWLFEVFALVYVALFIHGAAQIIWCAVIVTFILINVAIERWAHPTNEAASPSPPPAAER